MSQSIKCFSLLGREPFGNIVSIFKIVSIFYFFYFLGIFFIEVISNTRKSVENSFKLMLLLKSNKCFWSIISIISSSVAYFILKSNKYFIKIFNNREIYFNLDLEIIKLIILLYLKLNFSLWKLWQNSINNNQYIKRFQLGHFTSHLLIMLTFFWT